MFYANNYGGELVLPDTLTRIGNGAFAFCESLISVDLSKTQITSIGTETFRECTSLTSIDLPDSLESIESYTFSTCKALTRIDLPDTVTSIGSYAFEDCESLTSINYAGTMEEWNAIDKKEYWNQNGDIEHHDEESVVKTIICSDGVITLE
ncbi:MAG: leucine-rich repeat domain-containing protein [Firmicutes bacterium]|nr:leucine-rich repeat domain-containing protein [Bacillota bacterium]